jgi:hypothetical protein
MTLVGGGQKMRSTPQKALTRSMMPIWKAKTEPKCRFFAWTLMHKKVLTANNLMKRGWMVDPTCKLRGSDQETPTHLCKDCPFTKEVWEIVRVWFGLTELSTVQATGAT